MRPATRVQSKWPFEQKPQSRSKSIEKCKHFRDLIYLCARQLYVAAEPVDTPTGHI